MIRKVQTTTMTINNPAFINPTFSRQCVPIATAQSVGGLLPMPTGKVYCPLGSGHTDLRHSSVRAPQLRGVHGMLPHAMQSNGAYHSGRSRQRSILVTAVQLQGFPLATKRAKGSTPTWLKHSR